MKKININNISIKSYYKNYIYVVTIKDNNIILKRINKFNKKNIIIINIRDYNDVDINSFLTINNLELDSIITNILEVINNNLVNDILNVREIEKILKNNYINILISNGIIGLSSKSINDIKNINYILDIVDIESNKIIGNLEYNNDTININVDDEYKVDSLNLFTKLICLFNNKENYIKILKNNML